MNNHYLIVCNLRAVEIGDLTLYYFLLGETKIFAFA